MWMKLKKKRKLANADMLSKILIMLMFWKGNTYFSTFVF